MHPPRPTSKGETARDTLADLEAMGVHGFVVRHHETARSPRSPPKPGPGTALVNAGDGRIAHPTQGLLDMLTLRQAKGADFSRLKVADRRRREAFARRAHRPACAAHAGRRRDPRLRPGVAAARRRHARRLHGDAGFRRGARRRRRGHDAAPAARTDGGRPGRLARRLPPRLRPDGAAPAPRRARTRWCCIRAR